MNPLLVTILGNLISAALAGSVGWWLRSLSVNKNNKRVSKLVIELASDDLVKQAHVAMLEAHPTEEQIAALKKALALYEDGIKEVIEIHDPGFKASTAIIGKRP